MTNEAVQIEDFGLNPVQRTIANGSVGTDILKGTIMVLSDPNTVAANSGTGEKFGGILALDKEGGDGSTLTSCHMGGVFGLKAASGTVTVGDQVTTSGANLIRLATEAEEILGKCIGIAEETTSSAEVIRVRLFGQ